MHDKWIDAGVANELRVLLAYFSFRSEIIGSFSSALTITALQLASSHVNTYTHNMYTLTVMMAHSFTSGSFQRE